MLVCSYIHRFGVIRIYFIFPFDILLFLRAHLAKELAINIYMVSSKIIPHAEGHQLGLNIFYPHFDSKFLYL